MYASSVYPVSTLLCLGSTWHSRALVSATYLPGKTKRTIMENGQGRCTGTDDHLASVFLSAAHPTEGRADDAPHRSR